MCIISVLQGGDNLGFHGICPEVFRNPDLCPVSKGTQLDPEIIVILTCMITVPNDYLSPRLEHSKHLVQCFLPLCIRFRLVPAVVLTYASKESTRRP